MKKHLRTFIIMFSKLSESYFSEHFFVGCCAERKIYVTETHVTWRPAHKKYISVVIESMLRPDKRTGKIGWTW